MREVASMLRLRGHQVVADINEPLIEDSQIALICALLKLTLNLNDDISLAAVMCSPFGDFSVDELALLHKDGKKSFHKVKRLINSKK